MNAVRAEEGSINQNAHLVRIVAQQIVKNLPSNVDIDDLISAGTIGLLDSIKKFDSSRNVQFKTYASIRIRGAIMDELRNMDWMPRSIREKSNQLEKAHEEIERRTGGRPAEAEEVAKLLDITTDELHAILGRICASSLLNVERLHSTRGYEDGIDIIERVKDPDGKDPMLIASFNELKKKLAEIIEGSLTEREKLIISLYYYEELSLKEIGKVLDLTESRVCQIQSKVMLKLKSKLEKTGIYESAVMYQTAQ